MNMKISASAVISAAIGVILATVVMGMFFKQQVNENGELETGFRG